MRFFLKIVACSWCLIGISCTLSFGQGASTPDWESFSKDPKIIKQVNELLSQMTPEEKIGQMTQFAGQGAVTGPTIDAQFQEYLDKGMVGSMFNVFGAEGLKKLQKNAMEKSRLKIPILFAADVIHGYETIFPIPLAESCSWDLELMEQSARIAAVEATSAGISWTFAPMVDIARDARWGRVMEGAGEDVYLGSLVAKARVKGFQGVSSIEDFKKEHTLLACAKHFAAYGAAEAGRDYNTVDVSEHTLRETYFPPFEACIDAGVATFMTSFNEISGVPSTGSQFLYKHVLREEWGFSGMVVTDYTAINELIPHGYAEDLKHASERALLAGIDMDMNGAAYIQHLSSLLKEGRISEKMLDVATARILELKFMLGLFDDPYLYMDTKREKKWIGHESHKKAALDGAHRSIVLLKNKDQILPLKKNQQKKVALIGPMIKEQNSLNGEWAIRGDRSKSVSIFKGLQDEYQGSGVKFTYAKGCDLLNEEGEQGFKAAVNLAMESDMVLVAMGEDFNWSGEAASRTNIKLPEPQRALLKALKATDKPIVLVLLNGRPLNLSWEDEHLDAIVEAWYPGEAAGTAIADIISGDYNPSAKLTMSFPRNVGQLPIYYNHKNTGRPLDPKNRMDYKSSYLDVENSPLYPFGYGLSYTTFKYSNLSLSSEKFSVGGEIQVSVEVKNTGDYDGEEIVQLYIQDIAASVTQPVKSLKGFQKIMLKKGEQKRVSFTLNEESIKILTADLKREAEAGKFNLWVGNSSNDASNHKTFYYE
ncbi:beta-glucosidase BglX [Persicobacter psychrovividus]|uniref:beta-glucosidase n=1 Tax=Persicobacter psychrovividus TaxID=387638 RepID=A0ABN6L7A5_9BACT|nr:glycosyl hydrolase [Persicobacter psychrovividus]